MRASTRLGYMRQLLAVLPLAIAVGCASVQPPTPSVAAPADPYPGSGGKFLGTPNQASAFSVDRFAAFQIGATTKAQVAEALGKPEAWVTHSDGTSQLHYAYAGPTSIVYTLFEFDTNKILSGMHYPSHLDPAQGPFLPPSSRDYYPSNARRQGVAGRVGLECSVDEKGHARDIVVLESGGSLLDDAAKTLLSDAAFRIPPDWSTTGGPAKRFRYGVIFRLVGKPDVAPFDDNRRTVIISAVP